VVSNPIGPDNVVAATVTDIFSAQITSTSWTCVAVGGATCTASGGGSILDTVNLPVGSSITYTVTANISSNSVGSLINTATISVPALFTEVDPSNNTATDSDAPSNNDPNIGPPDGSSINVSPGTAVTILFSPAIIANGDLGTPDFVYYEKLAAPTHIDLDWVRIEISSDGITWYQVFFWGGPPSDTNTNVDLSLVGDVCQVGGIPTETDNCSIPIGRLYNSTGITIDIDGIVPPGSYPWMRISSPAGSANGSDVDAIQPYYP